MVTVFAREITDDLASLVKQIDDAVEKNKEQQLAAFVVLLTDDADAAEAKLKALAEKQKIKSTPLTVFEGAAGPPPYKVSKDADVTVLMWKKTEVVVNHAFAKGGLNKEAVAKVVADTSKILQ